MAGRTVLRTTWPLPDNKDTINVAAISVEVKLKDDEAASDLGPKQMKSYQDGLRNFGGAWDDFVKTKKLEDQVKKILGTCRTQLTNLDKGKLDSRAHAKKRGEILLAARTSLNRACFFWAKEFTLHACVYYAGLLNDVGPGEEPKDKGAAEKMPERPLRKSGQSDDDFRKVVETWVKEKYKPWKKKNATGEPEEPKKLSGEPDGDFKYFQKQWKKEHAEWEEAMKQKSKKPTPATYKDKFKTRIEAVPGKGR